MGNGGNPFEAWAEIIRAAAVSPLGIAALALLIMAFAVYRLIDPKDKPWVRLSAIVTLMVSCFGLMGAAIYTANPTTPSREVVEGSKSEEPPKKRPGIPPGVTPPAVTPPPSVNLARKDCGTSWSGWIEVGGGVGNPCPDGCARGEELGQTYRVVGFPPRPQTKHKFQCWQD